MIILFPSSTKNIKEIDYDLQNELDAVMETGLFSVVFFDYQSWFQNNELKLYSYFEINEKPSVLYRGWMMKPEKYRLFYEKCLQNELPLITTPEQYELFHIYPNIYSFLQVDAVPMMNFTLHQAINIADVGSKLGRFMVKDYVKSVKGTDFPTFFQPNISQKEFDIQMEKFYQYRGNLLTGGILCKQYIDLKKYDGRPNEYRVFYANGTPISICRNSNQILVTKEPPMELIQKYTNLDSPFYTIDYAEKDNGEWVIIEAGDGQVSGPSPNQNLKQFYRNLQIVMEQENEREIL